VTAGTETNYKGENDQGDCIFSHVMIFTGCLDNDRLKLCKN
jgi:hypothetical protein